MTWTAAEPRPGFWMVKVARLCPFVAARIYLAHTTADPVSGEPMDRSPFMAAQIGLDTVSVGEVWRLVEFLESSPDQQSQLATPPLSTRVPRGLRAPAFAYPPMPIWMRERARWITKAEYDAEMLWLSWAQGNSPKHPEYTWRKPVDRKAMPVPRFGEVA
jgi:hypothetical protein